MTGNKALKIIIPLIIAGLVLSLYLMKNPPAADTLPGDGQEMYDIPEHLKDADFSKDVTEMVDFDALCSWGIPVIVDYGADYCAPCRVMKPSYDRVHKKYIGKAFIKYADVGTYPETASNVPVSVIPTQVFFSSDGKAFVPSEQLSGKIEFYFYTDKDSLEHTMTVHHGALSEEELEEILEELGAAFEQ